MNDEVAKQFREELLTTLNRCLGTQYGALVTYALRSPWGTSDVSHSGFVTCRWAFNSEKIRPRRRRDYGNLILGEQWIAGERSVTRLCRLLAGSAQLERRRIEHFMPPSARWDFGEYGIPLSAWPSWEYTARLPTGSQIPVPHDVVAKHGLPPYESGAIAIMDWVWPEYARGWGGGNPRFLGEVLALAPDLRGRIKAVEWEGSNLKVQVDGREISKLEIQVVSEGSHAKPIHYRPRSDDALIVIDQTVRRLTVYLVHEDQTVLGKVRLDGPGREFQAHERARTVAEIAERDIAEGEGSSVEFKPFIDHRSSKEREILETVIAFANSGGGRLYVGLQDDGTPCPDSRLFGAVPKPKDASNPWTLQEALSKHVEHLQSLVREKIKPVPIAAAHEVELNGGHVIVAIHVQQGHEAPYSTHDNDVYIRKGATNRKPDPHTELQPLFGTSPLAILPEDYD